MGPVAAFGELFNVPTEVPDAALCGECEEDAGAPPAAGASTGPAPRQGRFAGGPAPQQGSLLTHVEARLESMTVPTPTAHINPYYYPLGELWPWALAGALRGMRRAMLDNPALVPPTWVDAARILNNLEKQAKAVGSRGGGPAGKVEQRIEQQDWATNLADLRREVAPTRRRAWARTGRRAGSVCWRDGATAGQLGRGSMRRHDYAGCGRAACRLCDAFGDGWAQGKAKMRDEIVAAAAERRHAADCGCVPCAAVREVLRARRER